MYFERQKENEFENKFGYANIIDYNKVIGKKLDFKPSVEYAVCKDNACCYSPSNVGSFFRSEYAQKAECDRYLEEQKEKYPEGWVIKEGYETTKLEYYPQFHKDWNHLIEAIGRMKKKGVIVRIDPNDIFKTWENLTLDLNDCD